MLYIRKIFFFFHVQQRGKLEKFNLKNKKKTKQKSRWKVLALVGKKALGSIHTIFCTIPVPSLSPQKTTIKTSHILNIIKYCLVSNISSLCVCVEHYVIWMFKDLEIMMNPGNYTSIYIFFYFANCENLITSPTWIHTYSTHTYTHSLYALENFQFSLHVKRSEGGGWWGFILCAKQDWRMSWQTPTSKGKSLFQFIPGVYVSISFALSNFN